MMSYSSFGTEDFTKDPYFQAWVLQDDPAVNAFWELWLELHPEKADLVATAIDRVLAASLENIAPPAAAPVAAAWGQLQSRLVVENPLPRQAAAPQPSRKKTSYWLPLAASLTALLLLSLGLWLYGQRPSYITYASRNSQVIPVALPDGSQVVLNANSSLTFNQNWDDRHEREVWLKGEAFFSVTRQPLKGQPTFTVHAPGLQVQVLGTRFQVADRRAKTQVILNTGKIRLLLPGAANSPVLTMRPGDYVALGKKDKKLVRTRVNPDAFAGWRTGQLTFHDTPLAEILDQIEQTYGTKVSLSDPRLLHRTFTGTFPKDNLPVLLQTLAKAFQLELSGENQTLAFTPLAHS